MNNDKVALASAFQRVDGLASSWTRTGEEGKLKVVKEQVGDELTKLRQEHVQGYLDGKEQIEKPLREQRLEIAKQRIAASAVVAVREALGPDGKELDGRSELEVAKPIIDAAIKQAVSQYVTARVPVVKAAILAAQESNEQVAEGVINTVVDQYKPLIDSLIPHVKKADLRNGEVFKAIAEQVFLGNQDKLLTDDVRRSLRVTEADDKQANEKAKPILLSKIQQRLQSLVSNI